MKSIATLIQTVPPIKNISLGISIVTRVPNVISKTDYMMAKLI